MAITIKNQATPPADASPHAQAAATIGTDHTSETVTKHTEGEGGSTLSHEEDTKHVQLEVPMHDRVTVGMSFKMPVAQYVMIEFNVSRASDCAPEDADATFDKNKDWVEARINALVAEQQASAE